MYTAEVRFPAQRPTRNGLAELVHRLLTGWNRNGQILEGWVIAARPEAFLAFVSLPAKDSLADRFANKYVRELMRELTKSHSRPEIQGQAEGLKANFSAVGITASNRFRG